MYIPPIEPLESELHLFNRGRNKTPWLCSMIGHRMRSDTGNMAGPSTCARKGCEYKEPRIRWPLPPDGQLPTMAEVDYLLMPQVKPPRKKCDCNPCGCKKG